MPPGRRGSTRGRWSTSRRCCSSCGLLCSRACVGRLRPETLPLLPTRVPELHEEDQADADDDAAVGDVEVRPDAIPHVPLHEVAHRAELHFAVRAALGADDLERAATTLANLAAFPFLTGRSLDWWHTLVRFGSLPGFPSCSAILLHPAFTHGGWDRIEAGETTIKILNVVPITEDEMATARDEGVGSLMERIYRDDIDLLRDRD